MKPDLPPFTGLLAQNAAHYRPVFMSDGYVGRDDTHGPYAHPMYGMYAVKDYLDEYSRSRSTEYLEAALTVGRASIARMEPLGDTLAFFFGPGDVMRQPVRHIAGLTQAYYAAELARLASLSGAQEVREAADAVFRSLLIPVSQGGPLHFWEDGRVSLEEVPQEPASVILNGWLSILFSMNVYAELSRSDAARALFAQSCDTLAGLLPLYDAPDICNSRYGLTGFTFSRLVFGESCEGLSLLDAHVVVPGDSRAPIPVWRNHTRWQNYILAEDVQASDKALELKQRALRANLVLSLASGSKPNWLELTVISPTETVCQLQLFVGEYDPLKSAPVNGQWAQLGQQRILPGKSVVTFEVPLDVVRDVAYATNFLKVFDGKNYNVYHFIHISRLRQLHAKTGIEEFAVWADIWDGYTRNWPNMPLYAHVEHERHR